MSIIMVYVWLRATLPRLRYDALMNMGWKRMLWLALVLLFVVAGIDTLRTPDTANAAHSSHARVADTTAPKVAR